MLPPSRVKLHHELVRGGDLAVTSVFQHHVGNHSVTSESDRDLKVLHAFDGEGPGQPLQDPILEEKVDDGFMVGVAIEDVHRIPVGMMGQDSQNLCYHFIFDRLRET